jgi:hypothetical protein
MISMELQNFYERWLLKAEEYQNDNLQDCFDRFFTLFVAYNRLYAELALSCVKRGVWRWNYISDGLAAKSNVQTYLGNRNTLRSLEDDCACTTAISSVIDLLERRVFTIKLDGLYGARRFFASKSNRFSRERRVEADSILLEGLKSVRADQKVHAVLDLIYSIRCNMFHGQKGYNDVQIQILVPVTILLKKIMGLLYEKMSQDCDL